MDRDTEIETPVEGAAAPRHNIADDVSRDAEGGTRDDGAGAPGGTLGTGGAREQDQ